MRVACHAYVYGRVGVCACLYVCVRARVHVFAHLCAVSEVGVGWCVVYQHTERLRKSERTHARARARERKRVILLYLYVCMCVCVCECTRHILVRKKCSTHI